MREFWDSFKKNITFEKIIVRLIMAWLLTAIVFFLKSGDTFNSAAFAADINVPMYACFMLLFFVFFCGLGYMKVFSWAEVYGPMILVTLYGLVTISSNTDVTYLVGILAVLAVSIAYAASHTKIFAEINKTKTVVIIYIVAAVFYMLIAGTFTVLRYVNYSAPGFDFGIWVQMFHNMKTTLEPVTTVERNMTLSHFAVHFSPIYYLYLPFYFFFPYPVTLQVLQVITVASGIIPVYLLCKKFGLSKSATACFGIIFALFPTVATGCYYDLHENCFLIPLILWLFYAIEKDDIKGIIILSLLTMLVKEDAPVYIACIGLFTIFGKRKYIKGTAMTVSAVAYFLVVTTLMQKYGLGVMTYRYSNFMVDGAGSLMDVIRNFVTNPAYAIAECFGSEKYPFLLYMFAPLGALPVATKKVSQFILLLPMLIINLATDYQYQYSIFFQYVFGVTAILFYLAISNYAELGEKSRRFMCSFAICSAIIIMPVASLSKSWYISSYSDGKAQIEVLNDAMKSIPSGASVGASTFFVPHLANRTELYEYPYKFDKSPLPDYLVIDLRFYKITEQDEEYFKENNYVETERVKGLYLILHRY